MALLLCLLPQGDIAYRRVIVHDLPGGSAYAAHRESRPDEFAVAPAHLGLKVHDAFALEDEQRLRSCFRVGVEIGGGYGQEGVSIRVAQKLNQSRVRVEEASLGSGARKSHGNALEQVAVALLALSELHSRQMRFPTETALLQRTLHRRPQTPQTVLQQVVGRPQLQERGHRVFSHGPRHHDEGNVQPLVVHQLQRPGRVELRQGVIGDDQVEG